MANLSGLELTKEQQKRYGVTVRKYGHYVRQAMENIGPANPGENFESWMSRSGAEYKRIMAELNSNTVVREPVKARGFFVENGEQYEEYVSGGKLIVRRVLNNHDQYAYEHNRR